MNPVDTSRSQSSQLQSAITKSRTPRNSTSSKTTIKQTSKTRNFGWLVKGIVERCHQISTEDLVKIALKSEIAATRG